MVSCGSVRFFGVLLVVMSVRGAGLGAFPGAWVMRGWGCVCGARSWGRWHIAAVFVRHVLGGWCPSVLFPSAWDNRYVFPLEGPGVRSGEGTKERTKTPTTSVTVEEQS
jgi:hypothetical protein